MVVTQTIDLIDSAAAEAFIQLAKTTDKFERYENPHAQRIAPIANEIAQQFQLARHDRGSLYAASLLHDLGEVAMERDFLLVRGPPWSAVGRSSAGSEVYGGRVRALRGSARAA